VTLRPRHSLDLAVVRAYMAECKVAKQYWPERVEVVKRLPLTPSGKIQKFSLRELAKSFGDAVPPEGS
jgi:cyclohexanecarboxylate-CoA ligase